MLLLNHRRSVNWDLGACLYIGWHCYNRFTRFIENFFIEKTFFIEANVLTMKLIFSYICATCSQNRSNKQINLQIKCTCRNVIYIVAVKLELLLWYDLLCTRSTIIRLFRKVFAQPCLGLGNHLISQDLHSMSKEEILP